MNYLLSWKIVGFHDRVDLRKSKDQVKIQIGAKYTQPTCGKLQPEFARHAALEEHEVLTKALIGGNLVFIVAGMGGSCGTGAAPVIAEIARKRGVLTIGFVSKPFSFGGEESEYYC